MGKMKLGFLASHGGSNMQAIIDNCNAGKIDAEPAVVISNNSGSGALERAENEGIPHYHISGKTHPGEGQEEQAILDALEKHGVELLILAGYMKMIGKRILRKYENRILNIHPALLPAYGGKGMYGMKVHEAVIAAGEKFSGVTVHLVNEKYDRGKILAQSKVPVMADDTPESLAARVLEEEHRIYSDTIQDIIEGGITLD